MSMFGAAAQRTALDSEPAAKSSQENADPQHDAALARVAISIVHDLRSPLAAIHSGAEMLSGPPVPEHQVRRIARNMYLASVRIQELLEEYVERCRARNRAPHSCNLRGLISHSVERITGLAEAQSVEIQQDIPSHLAVTVDRRRIGSVVTNLLVNALEAMPSGGTIHIAAVAGRDSVVTRVADTGPGIPAEIRDCLFQPFVTARKTGGWGLGLAQAHQVVNDHGGEMWLESHPGGGACLAFSLPSL
jgi:signal transduction histidine kinase